MRSLRFAAAALALASCVLAPCAAEEEPLSIKSVASLALERGSSVIKAREALDSANGSFGLLKAETKPQVGLSTGYSRSFTDYLLNSSNYQFTDFAVDTGYIGLTLKQLLPTYGTVSLNASDKVFSYNGDVAYSTYPGQSYGPYIGQKPSMTLALNQPVFFRNGVTGLYKSVFRNGELGYLSASEQNRSARSEAIYDAIRLFFAVVKSRNDVDTVTKAVELKRAGVQNLERRLKAGVVAELDVWEMRAEEGNERENLLTCEYNLRQSEGELKAALGMDENSVLAMPRGNLDLSSEAPASKDQVEAIIARNPQVKVAEMQLEAAKLKRVIDRAAYASSLSVSMDISPHYSELREYTTFKSTFKDSFEAFGDDDSGWTTNFNISLNVPLYNGSRAKRQDEAGAGNEGRLREQLAEYKRNLVNGAKMLALLDQKLQERISQATDNLRLKKKEAEVGRGLANIGQKPELDVVKMEIAAVRAENDLEAAKMDLYLARLSLRLLLGEDLEGGVIK